MLPEPPPPEVIPIDSQRDPSQTHTLPFSAVKVSFKLGELGKSKGIRLFYHTIELVLIS
jgi:hypothetical protein